MPSSSYQKFQPVTNAQDRAELEALARELGGTVNYARGVVEYKVKGNGTKATRSVGLGEAPNLVPHAYETDGTGSIRTTSSGGQGGSGDASIAAPNVNLKPGDTGADVKKLQDYLVSIGLMTQAQVNTGYGTYGPQTTAAVAALQKSLGVDNSTGVGYYGPRTIAAATGGSGGAASTTGAGAGSGGTSSPSEVSPELLSLLENPNLTADQKAAIQSIYNAVLNNDENSAEKIKAAMKAATTYSDPYFKAQTRLVIDALDRGLSSKEGDLAFNEKQLNDALAELRADTEASQGLLSFDHQDELRQLAQKYETDLGNTRDNLAASGFTNSSRRVRAEQILDENNTGLVEGSNKKFTYDTDKLNRTLASKTTSVADQIANLRRLTAEGKLDLYRNTEQQVGSDNLPNISGLDPLGDIGGEIPRKQAQDAFSFASNFVY